MPQSPTQDQIADTLKQQIQAATHLKDLLLREREALEGRDIEGFEKIVAEKQSQVTGLAELEHQRGALVTQAGYDSDPERFSEYLAAEDTRSRLGKLADQLRDVLSECFQLNRINGGIAELSYHYLNQSLAVLRGTQGNQKDTYGPQGKPIESGDSQRTIAKV